MVFWPARSESVTDLSCQNFLTANIPDVHLEAVLVHGFDVKSLSGFDLLDLLRRQPLQDRRLAGVIEAKDQKANLLLGATQATQQSQQTLNNNANKILLPGDIGSSDSTYHSSVLAANVVNC